MIQQTARRVSVFDNHDGSLHLWDEMCVNNATVVHVDAHHDLFTDTGMNCPSIGDYLRWALAEGVVREIYWVIPEPAFETASGLSNIQAHLKVLAGLEKSPNWEFDAEKKLGWVMVNGRKVTACSIKSLPEMTEPVLLDIDTDYMVTDDPPFSSWSDLPAKPWVWPDELANQLRELALTARAVTICYSVSGGYTPLRWKHLGDDLARIIESGYSEASLESAAKKRQMCEALIEGDLPLYHRLSSELIAQYPHDASLQYWKGLGHLRQDDTVSAREAVQQAINLDDSYAATSGFPGVVMAASGNYDRAGQIYKESIDLNDGDATAWHGLGRIELRNGNIERAHEFLAKSAAISTAPAEAHRDLAMLLESEGKHAEARSEYISFLRAAFSGRSIEQPIATVPEKTYKCPHWAEGYSGLGRMHTALGDAHLAANCYAQAMKLMNPRLYEIAYPLLAKMPGSRRRVSAAAVTASAIKTAVYAAGMGIKGIHRAVKRALLYGRTSHNGARHVTRICPPIRIKTTTLPPK